MASETLYAILGIEPTATPAEVKRGWHRMSKKHHPDKNDGVAAAEERIKQINAAYKVLSNPESRAYYDQHGTAPEEKMQASENADLYAHIQRAMQAAITACDPATQDLIEVMRKLFKDDKRNLSIQMAEAEGKMKRLQNMIDRIECKGEENVLAKIMRPQIDSMAGTIKIMQFGQALNDKALELLKDYSYRYAGARQTSSTQAFTGLSFGMLGP